MTSFTRRDFFRATSLAAATVAPSLISPRVAYAMRGGPAGRTPRLYLPRTPGTSTEPDLRALAIRATEAARSAGATYADAHVTLTRRERPGLSEGEERAFGVRVLANGYWGFLASAVWTPEEAVRLARGAVVQAKARSRGKVRPVELGMVPAVQRGEWIMPVKSDPFDIPIEEKLDVMNAFVDLARSAQVGVSVQTAMFFVRQYHVFASSEGSSWAQTTYQSSGGFAMFDRDLYHAGLRSGGAAVDFWSPAGVGWELIAEAPILEAIPRLLAEADASRYRVPVDVGRYDMVLSAEAMSSLVDETLGAATELDRALGYEANAGGTSYLDDPLTMLGTQNVGSSHVNVTANRSLPGGAATVKWDDEGVVPDEFSLVADGILVDYQTTREQAAWVAPYYQRVGRPIRSHGCAMAPSALSITMQHTPNIALMPGKNAATFESLIASTEKGVAVLDLDVSMDQQQLNGMASGTMREITRGKLGRFIVGGALMFRSPELWKSVVAIGGPGTQRWFGRSRRKGQPGQSTTHSVGGVPAKLSQLSLVDATRKA